ncbi:hypothetical protein ACWD0Z_04420 [Streptomyces sp. NPDC003007]
MTWLPRRPGSAGVTVAFPCGDGLLVRLRTEPAHAVRVRVVRVGTGVLSYVLGRADDRL